MPFMIETFDDPDRAEVRQERYREHVDFLRRHADLLLACGAKLSDDGARADGGLYLISVESREEAEAFLRDDPFARGGLFRDVQVRRWRKAFLDGRCFL